MGTEAGGFGSASLLGSGEGELEDGSDGSSSGMLELEAIFENKSSGLSTSGVELGNDMLLGRAEEELRIRNNSIPDGLPGESLILLPSIVKLLNS